MGRQRRRRDPAFDHRGARHPRVDRRLQGAVRPEDASMRRIPGRATFASRRVGTGSPSFIGVFPGNFGTLRQRGHVEPIPAPAVEMMRDIVDADLPEPAGRFMCRGGHRGSLRRSSRSAPGRSCRAARTDGRQRLAVRAEADKAVVGADQDRAAFLASVVEQSAHAGCIVAIAGDARSGLHGTGAQTLDLGAMLQQVELPR